MRHALALLAVLFVLPIAPITYASTGACGWGDGPALGVVPIDTPLADPTNGGGSGHSNGVYYVDDSGYVTGGGIWVYEETNGIGGLQRGGSSHYVPNDNEVCVEDPNVPPDQLIC